MGVIFKGILFFLIKLKSVKMTKEEAVIQSLTDIKGLANSTQIYEYLVTPNYCDFTGAKRPHLLF